MTPMLEIINLYPMAQQSGIKVNSSGHAYSYLLKLVLLHSNLWAISESFPPAYAVVYFILLEPINDYLTSAAYQQGFDDTLGMALVNEEPKVKFIIGFLPTTNNNHNNNYKNIKIFSAIFRIMKNFQGILSKKVKAHNGIKWPFYWCKTLEFKSIVNSYFDKDDYLRVELEFLDIIRFHISIPLISDFVGIIIEGFYLSKTQEETYKPIIDFIYFKPNEFLCKTIFHSLGFICFMYHLFNTWPKFFMFLYKMGFKYFKLYISIITITN
ncbi:hypothetical protein ACTFIU_003039 [Dictyostelium citrinum]